MTSLGPPMTQDTLPHLKFFNVSTSAEFLLPSKTACTQGPGIREVDTLEGRDLPLWEIPKCNSYLPEEVGRRGRVGRAAVT